MAMNRAFRFALLSDLHIGLPQTIWHHPHRFHLIECSIPAFEQILTELAALDLDFLLLPGDLTQHGERENHQWLLQQLRQLPYPVYVVPGNHDMPAAASDRDRTGVAEFVELYQDFGFTSDRPYYRCTIAPDLDLFALNSIAFDEAGHQLHRGRVDCAQLNWLQQELATSTASQRWVMIHHNVLEHLPDQQQHPLGQRYILENAEELRSILEAGSVSVIFTGHLHIQATSQQGALWEVTTGSLVSYPHPYRLGTVQPAAEGWQLELESRRVRSLPDQTDLQTFSREWMGDRSQSYLIRLLTHEPLNLSEAEAIALLPMLRNFWAGVADGDTTVSLADAPAQVRAYFQRYSRAQQIDNQVSLALVSFGRQQSQHRCVAMQVGAASDRADFAITEKAS
ncbi:hypothetical protein syc1154_c [Synechococcus elongatus PCC 6301]|nr:hypothetical protein syc1154_c [Synechococcus elongatus PCC 6301]